MTSRNSRMYFKNLSSKRVVCDVFQISTNIANDSNLSHFIHPVPTLILAFLCVGNNDYSGKIWGMSCETVYKALKKMVTDLACSIEKNNIDASQFSILRKMQFCSKTYFSYPFPKIFILGRKVT